MHDDVCTLAVAKAAMPWNTYACALCLGLGTKFCCGEIWCHECWTTHMDETAVP